MLYPALTACGPAAFTTILAQRKWMRRAIAIGLVCAGLASCGGVDTKKFEAVAGAGRALQQEVEATLKQPPRPQARDLLKKFDVEIEALHDKTIGRGESDALDAYAKAGDAFRSLLRFQGLARDAENNQIVLKGPDLEAATRYKLPVDSRGGARYVNSAQAITILLQAAEQHLSDGNRFISR